MQRFWAGFLVSLAAALVVLLSSRPGSHLLADSDTAAALAAIRARQAPLSWFVTDWPLGNHFYRPVTTLTLELDNALYGDRAEGYALTNAAFAALTVLGVFWVAWALTLSASIACASSILMSFWTLQLPRNWIAYLPWLGILMWAVLLFRRLEWRGRWLVIPAVVLMLSSELWGIKLLWPRMINWIPGRTASVMAAFALASIALYLHFERRRQSGKPGLSLLSLSGVSLALALCSYEQAVMIAPISFVGAWCVHGSWRKPSWQGMTLLVAVTLAYLAVRFAVIPSGASGYQAQQFRDGPGVAMSLFSYLCPVLGLTWQIGPLSAAGSAVFFIPGLYNLVATAASNIAAVWMLAVRANLAAIFGWAASTVAFAPMAFFKPFEHYDFLPMALRTLFVVGLGASLMGFFKLEASRQETPMT